MRKSVKIWLLAVPALLVALAGVARLCLVFAGRPVAVREAALEKRTDSLSCTLELLRGMDSLHRRDLAALLHQDLPADSTVFADSAATRAERLLGEVRSFSGQLRKTAELSRDYRQRIRCIPSICPLEEGTFNLSARFGVRTDPIEGDSRLHEGLDLACPQGNPVHVTADGVVEFIDSDIFGYGNCIVVNHGYGYQTRYAHLSIIRTSENIRLKRGDVIGETGVSGRATGPHLHYEVLLDGVQQDPEKYMKLNP